MAGPPRAASIGLGAWVTIVQEDGERLAEVGIVRAPAALGGGLENQALRILSERMPLIGDRDAEHVHKPFRHVWRRLLHGCEATPGRTAGSMTKRRQRGAAAHATRIVPIMPAC